MFHPCSTFLYRLLRSDSRLDLSFHIRSLVNNESMEEKSQKKMKEMQELGSCISNL